MTDHGTAPQFSVLDAPTGIRVSDPIEDRRFDLHLPESPGLRVHDPAEVAVPFPIDAAASVTTTRITSPKLLDVWVRDADGDLVATAGAHESVSLSAPPDDDPYTVEFGATSVKLYAVVPGAVEVVPGERRVDLAFGGETTVFLGARSFHDHPAGTITTPPEPGAMAEAISAFGGALKTTSPERSFPTLRGHPPLLEFGPALDIPGHLQSPSSDLTLSVPPEFDWLLPVAPLAYYLNADVELGSPALSLPDGRYPLGEGDRESFEEHVADVLQHVFLLDCVVRTEGIYDVPLKERREVEASVSLDTAALYDAPLGERVASYLDVPLDAVAETRPTWRLTADIKPDPEHLRVLPHLVNELAMIRCPEPPEQVEAPTPEAIDEFLRGSENQRSTDRAADWADTFQRVDPADTLAHSWVGPGFPVNASKATTASYERQLDRSPRENGRISVDVVCNDDDMRAEQSVSEIYGGVTLFEFDVTIHDHLSKAELRDVLRRETDLVHYIGHVDETGLQCRDGYLDAGTVSTVGAGTFFLNACQSYRQGATLVERGAIAGVTTLADVSNEPATRVGRVIARLLNAGYPLQVAVELVREESLTADQYTVVGDGNVELVQNEAGTPTLVTVESRDDDLFDVAVEAFPTRSHGMGTLYKLHLEDTPYYLNAGHVDSFTLSAEEVREFANLGTFAVRYDGQLLLSDGLVNRLDSP